MAYTNAIFYMDMVSGSDTARTALTSVSFTWNSGTSKMRGTKTGHGLVTGAIVDITGSTGLNAAWKITVIDSDNFDLDTSTNISNTSGTVTPRGGSSWSDAWLTIPTGATSARIAAGDEIRVAKTADPVSLGQSATFTNNSQTITLTTAVTKKIEDAISGWTMSTNITGATTTSRKIGSTSQSIAALAAFTTGKMAYKAIAGGGTQDFSAYTQVSFWMRSSSSVAWAANDFYIALCSDTTGDVVVNQINVPANPASTVWQSFVVDYGGALGSSIQSVALYAAVDPGTNSININNIFATSSSGLHLNHVIGKSDDCNYTIQSIDGTTIKIDSNNTSAAGQGYSGTSESVTLYYYASPILNATTGIGLAPTKAGDTTSGYITYSGGWNTSNTTQDGYTVLLKTTLGSGAWLSLFAYNKWSNWKLFRFANQNTSSGSSLEQQFDNIVLGGGTGCMSSASYEKTYYNNCKFLNLSGAPILGASGYVQNCEFRNCGSSGISVTNGFILTNCTFANNASGSISPAAGSSFHVPAGAIFRNCLLLDSTEGNPSSSFLGFVWSYNNDQTAGNHWGWTGGGNITWQTTTKQGSDPRAWKLTLTNSTRGVLTPIKWKIAEIGCIANTACTVTVWVKKDHATNILAQISIQDAAFSLTGISATSTSKTNDTNWEQLSISFTPTEAGFVPIWFECWYNGSTTNAVAYVGSITSTQ